MQGNGNNSTTDASESGIESIDRNDKNGYNKTRGEGYERTDEFRDLQAEVQRMSDEVKEMYHSGNRTIDEGLRKRFSRSVKGLFVDPRNNVTGNGYGLLTLSDNKSNNQFNIHQNVNGELFHDVFEMARSYLKYGE